MNQHESTNYRLLTKCIDRCTDNLQVVGCYDCRGRHGGEQRYRLKQGLAINLFPESVPLKVRLRLILCDIMSFNPAWITRGFDHGRRQLGDMGAFPHWAKSKAFAPGLGILRCCVHKHINPRRSGCRQGLLVQTLSDMES